MTFAQLNEQARAVRDRLHEAGLAPRARVAIVVSEAAELATALLSVAACGTAAPLNPAYRPAELEFCLRHLKPDAVLWDPRCGPDARDAAARVGLPVLTLQAPETGPAGCFELALPTGAESVRHERRGASGYADESSPALVLHTSGSTSRPKIVPLTDANLLAAASSIASVLGLSPADRSLVVMPLFHIHGLSAVLASLVAGGSIACPPRFEAPRFCDWLQTLAPTWYTAAPAIHRAALERFLADGSRAGHGLRFLRSASAPLPEPLRLDLERAFRVPVIQAYGMTEAAPQVASNRLPPGERKAGSAGKPAGADVAILDAAGRPLGAGERGEIGVRGPNVTHGYEDDPEANRGAFAHGWFHTGDEGYLDSDGYLYVTGRLKEIINRGGEKISPFEIEERLMSHPAVAQAAAVGCADERLGESVHAAVVLRPGAQAGERELREHVAAALADFKVPQTVHFVEALPVSGGGKLQRALLVSQLQEALLPGPEEPAPAVPTLPARDESITCTEEILAGLWQEVLGVERVGLHDSFSDLGGDSILAALIGARVQRALGVPLSVLAFFDAPTVAEMAESIDRLRRADWDRESLSPAPRPAGEEPLLSFAQQGLWVLDQLRPGTASYNVFRAARLEGSLSVEILRAGLDELARRHEVLRTTFPTRNGLPQVEIRPEGEFCLEVLDLSHVPTLEQDAVIRAHGTAEAGAPFDLECGPLWRGLLLRLGPEEHVLVLVTHHIVGERWALGVLFRELASLYEAFRAGLPSPLAPVPLQYSDYAAWQRHRLQGATLDRLLGYWTDQLRELPPSLNLPVDFPRPAIRSERGARLPLRLSAEVAARMRHLARSEQGTLFMALLAAFQCLLSALSGQTDIVVGSPVAGRTQVELEGVVGWLSNTLVFRTDLAGAVSFRELLTRSRQVCLGAYAHQELPFEQLVTALQPERALNATPLFQVNFRLQNAPAPAFRLAGITLSPLELDIGVAKFELAFELCEQDDGSIEGFCEYDTELYAEATARRMGRQFEALVAELSAAPDRPLEEAPVLAEILRTRGTGHVSGRGRLVSRRLPPTG